MNILLTLFFVFLALVAFYATVGQRLPGARTLGYVLGQLVSNNNWRAVLFFVLAVGLSITTLVVYTTSGFPKSPLVFASRPVVEKLPALQKQGAAIADRLLGEEYFQPSKSATPAEPDKPSEPVKPVEAKSSQTKSSSWWWLVFSCVAWLVALLYLPVAFRDEAWGFFSRLKTLGSASASASVSDNGGGETASTAPRRSESDAPRGIFGWFWYLFDEFFVEGMIGLFKRIIGARA